LLKFENKMEGYCQKCPKLLFDTQSCPIEPKNPHNLAEILIIYGMSVASILPYVVSFGILLNMLIRRTTRSSCIFFSLFTQLIMCGALKDFMRIERPTGACSTTFGFPSCHSSNIAALVMWLYLEASYQNTRITEAQETYLKIALFFAPVGLYSRLYLNYHTLLQVIVGVLLGASISTIWFYYVKNCVLPNPGNLLYRFWTKYKFKHTHNIRPAILSLEKEVERNMNQIENMRTSLQDQQVFKRVKKLTSELDRQENVLKRKNNGDH